MFYPKISIIIPIYNAEKFLSHCIDSILEQSYINLEILLVNDGSTDNSLSICEYYALKDNRIKVFTQINKGVSAARNLGLLHAKGEWIYFMDADDCLINTLFLDFKSILLKNKTIDIFKFGYVVKSDKTQTVICDHSSYLLFDTEDMLYYNEKNSYYGFLWNTLFRRSLISDLKFIQYITWCEDHIFSFSLFSKAKTMYISDKYYYVYYQSNSFSLSNKLHNPYMLIKAAKEEYRIKEKCITTNHTNIKSLIDRSYKSKVNFAIVHLYKQSKTYEERRLFYQYIGYPFNRIVDIHERLKILLEEIKQKIKKSIR